MINECMFSFGYLRMLYSFVFCYLKLNELNKHIRIISMLSLICIKKFKMYIVESIIIIKVVFTNKNDLRKK